MNERGFIAVSRGTMEHDIIGVKKPYSGFEAWLWLLFSAAYKSYRVGISRGHAHEVVTLERGQLTHSIRFMAEAWGWSRKSVCTFLDRLKKGDMIETQEGTLQTIITIRNYNKYQNPGDSNGDATETQTGTLGGRYGDKEEQINKDNNKDTGRYVFESGVIRLTEKDFQKWEQSFSHLDLRAELIGLTEWAGSQPKWFYAVSSALAKRNREISLRKSSPPSKKVLSPFGTEYPDGII